MTACQIRGTFMRSCQPRAPHPACFATPAFPPPLLLPAAGQEVTGCSLGVPHDLLWRDLSASMFSGYIETRWNPSPEVNTGESGLQPVTFRSAACVYLHACACQWLYSGERPAVR